MRGATGFRLADHGLLLLGALNDQQRGEVVSCPVLQGKQVKGRVLVIADGATSKLAMQMGYCTEPPKGVCSRAFIEGGTHNVDFDGAPLLPCEVLSSKFM